MPIHTARGRTATRLPTRAQKPCAVGSAEPKVGRLGQNTQRPVMTSIAGSSVTITSSVMATPIAFTGPRPAVEFISASIRQSMPATTVPALAKIAGAARCRAKAIASCRSSCRRSSSR